MSVVINYTCDYFSLIATDTRITYKNNTNEVLHWEDGREKLINLPNIGWTAGVGLAHFLDKFKE